MKDRALKIIILLTVVTFTFSPLLLNSRMNCQTIQNKANGMNTEQSAQNKYVPNTLDIGIGPIKELKLGKVDFPLAEYGKRVFEYRKCGRCHVIDESKKAPMLRNITMAYTPEYIMNYLLNMKEMQEKDKDVKRSIHIFKKKMPLQHLNRAQVRALLEYFRLLAVNKNYN